MNNLLPSSDSYIVKYQKSQVIKPYKFFDTKSEKRNFNVNAEPSKKKNPLDDIINQIEKKVIKIDKILKNSLLFSKKQNERKRVKKEQTEFKGREKDLEKKKLTPTTKGVKLPTPPKMGFLDWIKNFITQTILGFFAVRLLEFLPKLLQILPAIISVSDFLVDWGGKLLNGLVTFVDWGYKAIDATRGFIKNIGGEELAKNFDKFAGAIDNVLEIAIIAALVTASSGGDDGGGLGGKSGRRGFDSTGRRVGRNAQRRYERRFGRDRFIDRFGKRNLENLSGGARRGIFQRGARNAFMGLAGRSGAKTILKFVKPLVNKIPIIGGLIEFGLSWALGEPVGKAAFRGIGAVLVGAIGTLIGGPVGAFLGSWAGGEAGGLLYDMFFKKKKPKPKPNTNKLAGGGRPKPTTGTSRTSRPSKKFPVSRTLKRKKPKRTISLVPRKIKPGQNVGGTTDIQQVFPNPERPKITSQRAWWDPLGLFTGKSTKQTSQQDKSTTKEKPKPKGKVPNAEKFMIDANDVLARSINFGGFVPIIIKSLVGQVPDSLDYKNAAKGLNSWMQSTLQTKSLGFAGGGEVDAKQFFQGEDYTNTIAKSIEDSFSGNINKTVNKLRKELSLGRGVGREEMIQENIESGKGEQGQEGSEVGPAGSSGDKLTMARNLMRDLGLTAAQAAGIVGNMDAESGVENARPQGSIPGTKAPLKVDGKTGYGLVQWTSKGRQQALADFAKSRGADLSKPLSMDIEYQFFLKEFKGAYGNVLEQIKKAPDVKTASTIFMQQYEIPAGYKTETKIMERYNMSKPIYDRLAKGEGKATEGRERFIPSETTLGTGKFKVIEYITGDRNHPNLDIRGHGSPTNYHDHIAFATVAEKERAKRSLRSAGIQIGSEFRRGDPGFHGRNLAIDIPGAQWGGRGAIGNREFAGSRRVRQILGIGRNAPKFHGGIGISPEDGFTLKLHKGEMFRVIDKDSVDLFGKDFIQDIIDIENKSQLVSRAPYLIEKLKRISGYDDQIADTPKNIIQLSLKEPPISQRLGTISEYTDYERPYMEPEIQIVEVPVPIEVPVYMGTYENSSSYIISGGSDNSIAGSEILTAIG